MITGTTLSRKVRYQFLTDFTNETIECGNQKFTIPLPEFDRPWWVDFEKNKIHEPLATRTFIEEIGLDDVVWDLGSKFGYFSHIAATLSKPDNTYLFEADSTICNSRLKKFNQYAWNGQLKIIPKAVGDSSGSGFVTGDEIAARYDTPDFVKMDIEGAENAAVQGMKDTIVNHQPTLLIEVHPLKLQTQFDTSSEPLVDFLTEHYDAYICWEFRELDAQWKPFDEDEWRRRSSYSQYYQMLFKSPES